MSLRTLLKGCPRMHELPLSTVHHWDLDLVICRNYIRAKSESCICGVEQPDWLEECGYPKRAKREPDVRFALLVFSGLRNN